MQDGLDKAKINRERPIIIDVNCASDAIMSSSGKASHAEHINTNVVILICWPVKMLPDRPWSMDQYADASTARTYWSYGRYHGQIR